MPLTRLLLLVLAALWCAPAGAACTLSSTTASLGTASTFDLREGRVSPVAGAAGLACNGSVISLVASNYARVTAVSANGFRLRDASGNAVRYRVSADSAAAYDLTGGTPVDYFDPALVQLLGVLSSDRFAPSVYVRLAETPNLPPGTYSDTITLNWSWQVCHGVGLGGLCILAETGSGSVNLTVTLVLAKDCRVSAPELVFGAAPLASGFAPVRQAVLVDCSLGTGFTVGFTAGSAGSARPWRSMAGPGSAKLEYNIFRTDGTVWDEAVGMSAAGTGTGSVTPGLAQNYVAKINPAQADPPAGSYGDTVSVVVGF